MLFFGLYYIQCLETFQKLNEYRRFVFSYAHVTELAPVTLSQRG